MDRKGWFIITLCAIGLALNYWWGVRQRDEWLRQNPQPVADPAVAPAPVAPAAPAAPATGQLVNLPPVPAFEEKEIPVDWSDAQGRLKAWFDTVPSGVLFIRPDRVVAAECLAGGADDTARRVLRALHHRPATTQGE